MKNNRVKQQQLANNIMLVFKIAIIVIILSLLFRRADAQITTGYLVTVERQGQHTKLLRTTSDSMVNNIVNYALQTTDFDISKQLNEKPWFDVNAGGGYVYVQLMKRVKGKYRKIRRNEFEVLSRSFQSQDSLLTTNYSLLITKEK